MLKSIMVLKNAGCSVVATGTRTTTTTRMTSMMTTTTNTRNLLNNYNGFSVLPQIMEQWNLRFISSSNESSTMIPLNTYNNQLRQHSGLYHSSSFSPYSTMTTSLTSYNNSATSTSLLFQQQHRTYVSRAHPVPTPEYAVRDAMEGVLKEVNARKKKRIQRLKVIAKRKKLMETFQPNEIKHPDETIDVAINLNVDPRKPGQALRGTIILPNGTGKILNCIVFTSSPYLQQLALQNGAYKSGGDELIQQLVDGLIPIDSFQRTIATKEMMSSLSKNVARLLGPRGLMPNPKMGNILPAPPVVVVETPTVTPTTTPENDTETPTTTAAVTASNTEMTPTITEELRESSTSLMTLLSSMVAGKDVAYRTDKEGIIHVPIGKASFGIDKLITNLGTVMELIFDSKPEQYGKSRKKKVIVKKKKDEKDYKDGKGTTTTTGKGSGGGKTKGGGGGVGKNAKYLLGASISSTQGKSYKIETRTVDPSNLLFLTGSSSSSDEEKIETTEVATATTTMINPMTTITAAVVTNESMNHQSSSSSSSMNQQ